MVPWRLSLFLLIVFTVGNTGGGNTNQRSSRKPRKTWYRDSADPEDVKFYLYRNPDNEDERLEIQVSNYPSLVQSGYNPKLPLVLLIHGALSSSETFPDVALVKNEFLFGHYPVNIVMVDYSALTMSTLPPGLTWLSCIVLEEGKKSVPGISGKVAEFIYFLMGSRYLKGPEDVHIVGFSMGTNIASEAGHYIQHWTGRSIRRISGLDPAPNFSKKPWLTSDSAQFVDATFTWLGNRAKHKDIGHVQFFMNGGRRQPNCPNIYPIAQPYCSHFHAANYFAKSIRRKVPILGCRCDTEKCKEQPQDCVDPIVYGINVPYGSTGDYYVEVI